MARDELRAQAFLELARQRPVLPHPEAAGMHELVGCVVALALLHSGEQPATGRATFPLQQLRTPRRPPGADADVAVLDAGAERIGRCLAAARGCLQQQQGAGGEGEQQALRHRCHVSTMPSMVGGRMRRDRLPRGVSL